ncbi:MAG: PQQ-binding-like beta-propeller repeat protein [Coriobacteriia bacterium]|nr:PQQ-binding-like beta-propeller repeat protein [Coriobacteriia bacterium]
MSDTADAAVQNKPAKTKSRKGRRIVAVILIFLLLLLCGEAFLLFRLIKPSGGAAQETAGLAWVRSIYGINKLPTGALERAQSAVTASDGTIWVIDGAHRALFHFSSDGRFLGQMKGPKDSPLINPGRFTIGPDGRFYVCETALDTVRVLDASGQDVGSFKIPTPVSIDVSEDQIVVGSISGFAILEKDGKPIRVVGARGQGDDQFDYVHGVAIADDGKIYVSDSFNNRLSAYDATGERLWIHRVGNAANTAKSDGVEKNLDPAIADDAVLKGDQALQLPLELTLDAAGRIVVIDMFDCSLAVFKSQDGAFVGKYGSSGVEDGQFFYPQGVSYDAAHDWFTVADSLNNRVQIIRLPDTGGSALAGIRRSLAGPLRACLFPFLLLLLAIIIWLVVRAIQKRRAKSAQDSAAIEPGDSASSGVESDSQLAGSADPDGAVSAANDDSTQA